MRPQALSCERLVARSCSVPFFAFDFLRGEPSLRARSISSRTLCSAFATFCGAMIAPSGLTLPDSATHASGPALTELTPSRAAPLVTRLIAPRRGQYVVCNHQRGASGSPSLSGKSMRTRMNAFSFSACRSPSAA